MFLFVQFRMLGAESYRAQGTAPGHPLQKGRPGPLKQNDFKAEITAYNRIQAPKTIDANDPSAGSPTETLLRLLLPLKALRFIIFSEQHAAHCLPLQSKLFTGSFNR